MKEKVLILGGTEFMGRLVVEALQADETKEVYLFNRGKTNPNLFPEIKRITGDRETDDIEQIQSEQWDYIIDFSSYYPKSLKKTLAQINRDVKKYIYISTISVYDFEDYDAGFKIKEDYKKLKCSAEEAVDQTMKTYGKKKAACEEILKEASWLNSIILRPSIIYGRYDPTDRFYYWLRRMKKGNEIIIPNNGEDKLSLTYADDLVAIMLTCINDNLPNGIYNCNTHEPLSLMSMLEMMRDLLGSKCQFHAMDINKLNKEGIHLPLLFIRNLKFSNTRIKAAAGLEFISFKDSIKSQIKHFEGEAWRTCNIGITAEREKAIIQKNRSTTTG